jgi:hypothetical protein
MATALLRLRPRRSAHACKEATDPAAAGEVARPAPVASDMLPVRGRVRPARAIAFFTLLKDAGSPVSSHWRNVTANPAWRSNGGKSTVVTGSLPGYSWCTVTPDIEFSKVLAARWRAISTNRSAAVRCSASRWTGRGGIVALRGASTRASPLARRDVSRRCGHGGPRACSVLTHGTSQWSPIAHHVPSPSVSAHRRTSCQVGVTYPLRARAASLLACQTIRHESPCPSYH